MAKKPGRPYDGRKDFIAELHTLSQRHSRRRVFRDAMELFAISLANAVDRRPTLWEPREARYLEILKAYKPEEAKVFPKLLGALVLAYGPTCEDLFGSIFQDLELGNAEMGQFFTPFHLSSLMARLLLDKETIRQNILRRGFFTMQEPACGAGGMILATADTVMSAGFKPHRHMHVTAVDTDLLCVHMTYIQCCLWHIPAVIYHGDTLRMEFWSTWYTPAHVLGSWGIKLKRANNPTWPDLSFQQRLALCLEHDLDADQAFDHAPPVELVGIAIPAL